MNDTTHDASRELETVVSKEQPRWRRPMGLVAAAVVALAALLAAPQLATAAPEPPEVPANLAVPEGNVLDGMHRAQGFQIYTCQPQGTGYAWTLLQPMAVLLEGGHKPFALHFGGPSWMAMEDGSTVVGTRVDSAPAPIQGRIPWLLLKATSTSGPADGVFTSTTFIQRINTAGGVAPITGCDAAHVGTTTPVYYTADYVFYRAG
jgi:hypothetical protein